VQNLFCTGNTLKPIKLINRREALEAIYGLSKKLRRQNAQKNLISRLDPVCIIKCWLGAAKAG
jgi:hypothetical protein